MPAYLDHAATSALRPAARAAMLSLLGGTPGNPSGTHAAARAARRALDDARDQLAAALGCRAGEVVFTSGGTEADNHAVRGALDAAGGPGRVRAVCTAVEHHAVLDVVRGTGGTVVPVDRAGLVDLDALAGALGPDVAVVSVQLASNETGVVQPLADVAEVVARHAPQAVLHTDAVHAFPWVDVAALAAPAGLVSVSGHKFGGPQGVGALLVRRDVAVAPLLLGGGQERGRRSGTPNVAGAAGMAAAAAEAVTDRPALVARCTPWRDRLADGLLASVPGVVEAATAPGPSPRAHRTGGCVNLCFQGVDSEALLFLLDQAGVAASAGSSCASGAREPSHVLAALGVPRELAAGSLRLTMGWDTVAADIDLVLGAVPAAVQRLRLLDRPTGSAAPGGPAVAAGPTALGRPS